MYTYLSSIIVYFELWFFCSKIFLCPLCKISCKYKNITAEVNLADMFIKTHRKWEDLRFILHAVHLIAALKKHSPVSEHFSRLHILMYTTHFDVFYCLKLILNLLTFHCLDLTWHKNGTRQEGLTDHIKAIIMSHSFTRWKMVTQGTYAEWNLLMKDGLELIHYHCFKISSTPEWKKKKKLLESLCKLYNYFWAGKQHIILRSENKMFWFLTRSRKKDHLWLFPGHVSLLLNPDFSPKWDSYCRLL